MKKLFIAFILIISTVSFAQFRDQAENRPTIHDGLIKSNTSSMLLGFINPSNLSMHHSFDLSYSAFGGNGVALGVYTNSLVYKFAENLNIQTDISLINSPYNSFGKNFSDQINGIYLSRAQLNYQPWENVIINVQYSHNPLGYYNSHYGYGGFMDNNYWGW